MGVVRVVRPVREIAAPEGPDRSPRYYGADVLVLPDGPAYRGITAFDWAETGPVPTALTAATTNR